MVYSWWSVVRGCAAVCAFLFVFSSVRAVQSDRELLRLFTPVVDVIATSPTGARIYLQNFDAWEADASRPGWTNVRPVINADSNSFMIRRIGRVLHIGNIVLAGGHVVTKTGGLASAVLRSQDDGRSFDLVRIGSDTLGSADGLRMTSDGAVIFLDRVGRFWMSMDKGLTWTLTKLPAPVPPASAREVDMVNTKMGVCVDRERKIHFTTNGWMSVIAPLPSSKPIIRTQPTFLDHFNWNRDLTFWNSEMILVEGRDIFRTPSNDLLWQRWDTVLAFTMSNDRSMIAYYTTSGNLFTATSLTSAPKLVASNVLRPHFIRIDGDAVLSYHSDTGPVIYRSGTVTMLRPYDVSKPLGEPSLVARVKKKPVFGVVRVHPGSELVDLVKIGPSGMWVRDTIADIGPVRNIHANHPDSIIITTSMGVLLYHPPTKQFTPWHVNQPLKEFLSSPVSRFRVVVAADELDSTHVTWTEFRLLNGVFRCAELVDSSKFGVRSSLVDLRIPAEDVQKLLAGVNDRGDRRLSAQELTFTPEIKAEFLQVLDTLFEHDAYFDTLDVYRAPPAPIVQIEDCKRVFQQAVENMASMNADQITAALMSWRRVPKDEYSRYQLQFENRSGRFVTFTAERDDEAHLPLMSPWVGKADGFEWMSFDRGLARLFTSMMPPTAIPTMFATMSRDVWAFIAIGSYIDGVTTGRMHRWTD